MKVSVCVEPIQRWIDASRLELPEDPRERLPGKKRFSEIQRALTGISPKVLTVRLRLLERRQLLTRTVFATVPPMTEYELTPLGRRLEAVLDAMAEFGEQLPTDDGL